MKALLGKCTGFLGLAFACAVSTAQDVGVAHIDSATPLHPAVALERRIQSYIDELSISGEQEPGFRAAMKQVSDLESAYLKGGGAKGTEFSDDGAVLAASEKLLALILYPTQLSAFRELEQERLWQMRGQL